MRFLSEAERGVVDDHENVHPNILQQHYGVDTDDEDENTDDEETDEDSDQSTDDETDTQQLENLQDQFEGNEIAAAHEAVPVPINTLPFNSDNTFQLFQHILEQLQNEAILPHGYGVSLQEVQTEGYPTQEIIRSGRRGRKELQITLPIEIWLPRATRWCQALEAMTTVSVMQDT